MNNPRETLDTINRRFPKVASQWRLETVTAEESRTIRARLNNSAVVNRSGGRVWSEHRAESLKGCRCAVCILQRYAETGKGSGDAVREAATIAPTLAEELGIGE